MAKKSTEIDVKSEKAAVPLPVGTGNWSPFAYLQGEIDRLFDDFGSWNLPALRRPSALAGQRPAWSLSPAMDIVEDDSGFRFSAELPGLLPENVEVTVTDGTITIRGEKSEEKKTDKEDCHLSERRYGAFRRSFALPSGIEAEKISADFTNGVLTVSMPKSAEAKQKERKIEVTAA